MKLRVGAPSLSVSSRQIIKKNIDELEGIIKGILADKRINQAEADFLFKWLDAHKYIADRYPYNLLYNRLVAALEDGFLDKDEAKELKELMTQFSGGMEVQEEYMALSTTLPLDTPPPPVEFEGRLYCFTGTFLIGKRSEVERMVLDLGANVHKDVVMKLDYLVVGTMATKDWKHSHYGKKIEKAVNYKQKGYDIKIINEDWWIKHLPGL